MSEPLSLEEQRELYWRAKTLHLRRNLGGAFPLGDYIIDWVSKSGVWIYTSVDGCIYSGNAAGVHIREAISPEDWAHAAEALRLMRSVLVLDDLGSITGRTDRERQS